MRVRIWLPSRVIQAVAALVLFVLALAVSPPEQLQPSSLSAYTPAHASLVAAVGARQLTYRTAGTSLREAGLTNKPDRLQAEAAVENEFHISKTPQAKGAYAYLLLAQGRVDMAIALYTEALHELPGDARLLTDLAAASIARAAKHPPAWATAYERSTQALASAPRSPEALFNQARALGALGLPQAEADVWTAYLMEDPKSRWATVARRHLAEFRPFGRRDVWLTWRHELVLSLDDGRYLDLELIVRNFPAPVRQFVEGDLLSAWADSLLRGDREGADRRLMLAAGLADQLKTITGDSLVADSIVPIQVANRDRDQRMLRHLAEGHQRYGVGLNAYEQSHDLSTACPEFARAGQHLEAADSPFILWIRFYLASCSYYQTLESSTATTLEMLDALAHQKRYSALQARSAWVIGLLRTRSGSTSEAISWYRLALAGFARLNERDHEAYLHFLLAEAYETTGLHDLAWEHRYEALKAIDWMVDTRRAHNIYLEAADACQNAGQLHLALRFTDALVEFSQIHDHPVLSAEAHLRRSTTLLLLGEEAKALEALELASMSAREIPDPSIKVRARADIAYRRAVAKAERRPEEAIAHLNEALSHYHKAQYSFRLPEVFHLKGRIHARLGHYQDALKSYNQGLREFERQRATIPTTHERQSYFLAARRLTEDFVDLASDSASPDVLFSYQERSRFRASLDLLARGAANEGRSRAPGTSRRISPVTLPVLRKLLIPKEGALVLFLSRRYSHAWLATPERIWYHRSSIDREAVVDLISSFNSCLEAKPLTTCREQGKELYAILLQPFASQLGDLERLIVIPDHSVTHLSFEVLWDERHQRFLFESPLLMTYSPSASVLQNLIIAHDGQSHLRPSAPLVITLPTVAQKFDATLPPLPATPELDTLLASIYPAARFLRGTDATWHRLLALRNDYSTVHIAAHTLVDPDRPFSTRLLLAADPETPHDGAVTPDEIYGRGFANTSLLVLATCSSSIAAPIQSEAAFGLAGMFLTSGVRAVLASRTQIDSATADSFLLSFYRRLGSHGDPALAVREAQMAAFEKSKTKAPTWSTFRLIGVHRAPAS